MTAPPTPGLGSSILGVFRLEWKRLVRGRKMRLGLIAVGLVLVAVVAARYAQDDADPAQIMRDGADVGFFNLLVYLVPFLLTAGAIADEVESRTFTYLATRPASRAAIALGKYLAGIAMASALLVGGLLLMHVAVFLITPTPMIDELPQTLRAASVVLMLTMLYGAVCMFWGAVAPEAAGIVSVLYLAVVEFGFGKLPFFLRLVSMGYLGAELAGLPRGGPLDPVAAYLPDAIPQVPTWAPAAIIPIEIVVFLVLAMVVVSSSEYRFGKA